MIDVFDNVLEDHYAILIDDQIKNILWRYDYHSNRDKPNKHWHVLCGHDAEECGKFGYLWAHDLFQAFTNKFDFVNKYKVNGYERILFGGGQIISRDSNTGLLTGGSEPRKDGAAIGY